MRPYRKLDILSYGLSLSIAVAIGFCSPCLGSNGDTVTFRWHLPRDQVQTLQQSSIPGEFRPAREDREGDRSPALFYIFIGSASILSLADAAITVVRRANGGVVLDTRGDQVNIKSDPRLDGGVILIVTESGVHTIRANDTVSATEIAKLMAP